MIQNRTTPAKPNLTRIPKVIHLMNRILLWVGPKKSVFIIYDFFCKNLSSNERKLVLTGKVFHPFQLLKTAIVVFSANASGISKAKIILWFKRLRVLFILNIILTSSSECLFPQVWQMLQINEKLWKVQNITDDKKTPYEVKFFQ